MMLFFEGSKKTRVVKGRGSSYILKNMPETPFPASARLPLAKSGKQIKKK